MKEYKNRSHTAKTSNRQYNISFFPAPNNLSKREETELVKSLQNENSGNLWSKLNINFVLNKKKLSEFVRDAILCCGFNPKEKQYSNIKSTSVFCSDFLFFDFDKGELSYENAKEILKQSELNYILTTSKSYKESHPKLHIMIPTLKTISSNDEYRFFFEELYKKLFNSFEYDRCVANIKSIFFTPDNSTMICDFEFEKNDFHIELSTLDKKSFQVTTDNRSNTIKNNISLDSKALLSYSEQIKNLFGLKMSPVHSDNEFIRFYRNENDLVPAIYNGLGEHYPNKVIFDNHNKSNGKSREFKTFFAYKDYEESVNAKDIRNETLKNLEITINEFFINKEVLKNYVITNEGLGKSNTILELSKKHNFIYAFHTISKLDEAETKLKEMNIKYSRVHNVEQLLRLAKRGDLVSMWLEYTIKEKKPSFFDFLEGNEANLVERNRLLAKHRENNKKLNDENIVICTLQKLKIVLNQKMKIKNAIIFDEFSKNDWYRYSNEKEVEEQKVDTKIKNSWGSTTSLLNSEQYIYFYKNKNFIDLLEENKFLVLTTERTLVEQIFYKTNIVELKNKNRKNGRFDYKLKDDNVKYLLLKSTRKDNLLDIYDNIRKVSTDIMIISNSIVTQLRDKRKIEDSNVLTHLAVKGLNHLANRDTVILGTMKNEVEVKTHLINCREFYQDTFSNEVKEETEKEMLRLNHLKKDMEYYKRYKENYFLEVILKRTEPLIQQTLIENEISQSIGRNSGFRDNGKKTIVLIKGVQNNTNRRTLDYNFNYISSNIRILELENKSFKQVDFIENKLDDLDFLYNLVPLELRLKIPKSRLQGLTKEQAQKFISQEEIKLTIQKLELVS